MGGDDWSEFGFMHNYLKLGLNVTDQLTFSQGSSFILSMYVCSLHCTALCEKILLLIIGRFELMLFINPDFEPSWVTVDGGMV